jgi:hypothetical protein
MSEQNTKSHSTKPRKDDLDEAIDALEYAVMKVTGAVRCLAEIDDAKCTGYLELMIHDHAEELSKAFDAVHSAHLAQRTDDGKIIALPALTAGQ